ncbi:lipoate--protein ligase family protein [candidate division KSB1 bacterium]|nr:lipoate--protein ligase family protein [candidate division KSB1 bacterium]
MAIDTYLAQKCTEDLPILRFYRWSPHAISLGYGQKIDDIDLRTCQQDNIPVVRRPTGGRAVLHAEEVTYAVIIPKDSPWYHEQILETYHFISQGLVAGFRALNVDVSLERRTYSNTQYAEKSLLGAPCFSASAQYEIVYQGRKIVGSAQRRFDKAILQHGSILNGSRHLALLKYLNNLNKDVRQRLQEVLEKKTLSISQILNKQIPYGDIVQSFKKGFIDEYQLTFVDKSFAAQELSEINHIKTNFPNLWRRFHERQIDSYAGARLNTCPGWQRSGSS